MDDGRRDELERIMAALAGGGRAMVVALHGAFGDLIEAALRRIDRQHRLRVVAGADEATVDGLVLDACFELERVARAWEPGGGALPWVWGERRLLAVLVRHAPVGDQLPRRWGEVNLFDEPVRPVGQAAEEPDVEAVLDRLAHRSPAAALVREAMARAVRPDDRQLLLLHAEQVAGGDPSPATTVSRVLGRSPAAVRQAVARSRRRLADLAADEPRFRPLLRLPLLGPAATREAA